jgi:hypothetical protein
MAKKRGYLAIMNIHEARGLIVETLINPIVLEISRLNAKSFTRNRKMGFREAICFLLDMRKTTLQTRLNAFFRQTKGGIPMSQPAFTKLRAQFSHKPFEIMMRELVKKEYSGQYKTPFWRGYTVLATDGSYLQLPPTPELAEVFGVRGPGNRPGAGISVLYDVLHGWVLDAEIDRTDRNERKSFARHMDFLKKELPQVAKRALLLADRGYPSHDLLEKAQEYGFKYVMRCSTQSFGKVMKAPLGSSTVSLKNGQTVRAIKFLLDSGETETLVTNLFDVPEEEFPALYAMRWGVETLYHELKRVICVEKFSGKTPNSIRQDFWASMVLLIQAAIFKHKADEAVSRRQKGKTIKHSYQARTSDIVVTLRDRFIFASLCGHPILAKRELNAILREVARVVSPIRQDRSFSRIHKPLGVTNPFLKSCL